MRKEPHIVINGVELSSAQAMTVRVAISSMQSSLEEGLGDDDHGRAMTAGYQKHCHAINRIMLDPLQASIEMPVQGWVAEKSTLPRSGAASFPHWHRDIKCYQAADAEVFAGMLEQWYRVADILRQQPPGTVAVCRNHIHLVMAPLDGEIHMFDASLMLLESDETSVPILTPAEFDRDGVQLVQLRQALNAWLEKPVYAKVSPERISAMIGYTYDLFETSNWVWDGVSRGAE